MTVVQDLLDVVDQLQMESVEPLEGSRAAVDAESFPQPALVESAYAHGLVSLESASDHVRALDILVEAGACSFAPVTCMRGAAEAAAWASWLMNPRIGPLERASRDFALRYESVRNQHKMARTAGDDAAVDRITARLDALQRRAEEVGLEPVRASNGRIIGLGQTKPKVTDVLDLELDLGGMYRPLSAAAHADPVVLLQMGFASVEPREGGGAYATRTIQFDLLNSMRLYACSFVVRPLWYHLSQFGFGPSGAIDALNAACDRVGLVDNDQLRPWRQSAE